MQIRCDLARVTATYARRISSRILIFSTQREPNSLIAFAASLFLLIPCRENTGSSAASPRSAKGICFSFFNQLSGSLVLFPGKVPSAKPGTATRSHSAPLAIWIVKICTTSLRISGAPALSPPSASAATSSQSRNALTVPPLRSNFAASSKKRSKCRRPACDPSRRVISLSSVK